MKPTNGQTAEINLFDIDQHRLDEEWIRQPRLYQQYATELADAKRDWEQAKALRDLTEAELDQEIRREPAAFGLEKPTEASVKNAAACTKRHKRAVEAVIDAKHRHDVLQATVDSLDHRKRALEGLVQLFLANYFSEPRAPKSERRQVDEMAKQALRRQGQKASKE